MEVDEVKKKLVDGGFEIAKEERLANDTGTQIRLKIGQIINVFDNGTMNFQGKKNQKVQDLLGAKRGEAEPAGTGTKTKVFVVYGHDKPARDQLEAMLRRWGLEPLILDQLPSEGQTIIEKLESITSAANFGVVLASPDDEGHRAGRGDEKAFRARQNVVLELGMLLSKFGRKRVAILLKEQEKMERPSDIQGLIYIPFKDDLQKEAGQLLAKEMVAQGYKIDVAKL